MSKASERISAADVRRALGAAGKPLNQVELQQHLGAGRSQQRSLRGLLKGLVGSGEIEMTRKGQFQLPGGRSGGLTGTLRLQRGRLYLNELAVIDDRRRLRAGDEVRAREVDEGVQVLEVLRYSETPVIGLLRRGRHHSTVDSLTPGFRGQVTLTNDDPHLADGDTVEVIVDGDDGRGLVGRLSRRVVAEGDADRASTTLLASHGVPTEFPDAVQAACERLPKKVGPHKARRNLADLPFVTIDGEDARDFDDALYCEQTSSGWELWVAIADVGHYVKRGTALDDEAFNRGNSCYLPDRVVPMLPEALSNDLCSLRPEERRLALVCKMRVGRRGSVTGFEFFEAVIRSWARLTYTDVGAWLDGAALPVSKPVTESLGFLHKAYEALRIARERRGGLDFESTEVKLELDRGRVVALHPVLRNDAHKLVEESMIAANVCAAKFIEEKEAGTLYRNHEAPDDKKREQLRQAFNLAGVRFDASKVTPKSLAAAMAEVKARDSSGKETSVFDMLILRSLMQANYTPENKGHFGLGLTHYAHFTSPIRRYPDLIVHRVIKSLVNGKTPRQSDDYLVTAGEQTSMTERRAEDVERGVTNWLKCEYLSHHIGEQFDGTIAAVTSFGVFVELEPFYLQGLVHISNLGGDYYQFRPETQSLVGERTGKRFAMGDALSVTLTAVEPEAGKIDLLPVGAESRDDRPRRGRSRGGDQAKKRHSKGEASSGDKEKANQSAGSKKKSAENRSRKKKAKKRR